MKTGNNGLMYGKFPAIVKSYDAVSRSCIIETPTGNEVDAEIEYPIGDSINTEIQISSGDTGLPASLRPLPAKRLMARTDISCSQRIWQLSRTLFSPLASKHAFSAGRIAVGSPLTNSTRQVVQRAFPPQACNWSMPASSVNASTKRLPAGTSNSPTPSTVSFGI